MKSTYFRLLNLIIKELVMSFQPNNYIETKTAHLQTFHETIYLRRQLIQHHLMLNLKILRTFHQFSFCQMLNTCAIYCLLIRLFMALSLAVLEGVAIGANPGYKVLGSTYPWIARKVLTDSSPELKSSLHALLYEVKLQYNFLIFFYMRSSTVSFYFFAHCIFFIIPQS